MSTTVTIRSRCHEDWVPEWPHSHRIDEHGNLAIMSQCHRPEVAEWNDMDRLDDLVNAMHCRTGQVEEGLRPAGEHTRYHLKGMHRDDEAHSGPMDRYLGMPSFCEIMEAQLPGLCAQCVDRAQLRIHNLLRA